MLQKNAKLLIIALLLLVPHLVFALGIDQSWIRLRLYENLKRVSIYGANIELVTKQDSFRNVSVDTVGGKGIEIEFKQKWDQSFLLTKIENQISNLRRESIFIKGSAMSIQKRPIANFIQVFKRNNGFDIVAYIKMRDYLKGVVSAEMPLNWPSETLKAQIIAARSYAVYMSDKRKKMVFDLESSIKDQAYDSKSGNSLLPLIDATANLIIVDQDQKLFKTYYHSECGGQTSSAKKIFGDSNFDVEVKDPYCGGRSWQLKLTKHELENYSGPIKNLLTAFNPLKRAYSFEIQRPDLSVETIDAQKLRLAVGSTRMKSTWFELRQKGETVELKGKGYGHGVGLCQWGSRQMGIMKKNFHEILSFYYPKSILKMAQSNQLNF